MTLETLKMLYLIFFISAAAVFATAIVLYFAFDITYIFSILSGSKERRELKKIRAENRRKRMTSGIENFFLPGEEINYEEVLPGEEATTFLNRE